MDIIFNIESEEDFKTILVQIIDNLFNSNTKCIKIDESIAVAAKDEIKTIVVKTNCVTENIEDFLLPRGYRKERVQDFSSIVEERKNKLLYLSLLNHNSMFGDAVTKCDWVIKLVYGTSELKKIKYPLLQLLLITINNNKDKFDQKQYDIDKYMLDKLINDLENILMQ